MVGVGVPLVDECCKLVGGTPCGLGVGGWGLWVPLVYECCKIEWYSLWVGSRGWGQGSL